MGQSDKPNEPLAKPQTASYKPQPLDVWGTMPRDLPVFTWHIVRAMLWDPMIRLGLAMREAPIHSAELAYKDGDKWVSGIKCDDPAVARVGIVTLRPRIQAGRHDDRGEHRQAGKSLGDHHLTPRGRAPRSFFRSPRRRRHAR